MTRVAAGYQLLNRLDPTHVGLRYVITENTPRVECFGIDCLAERFIWGPVRSSRQFRPLNPRGERPYMGEQQELPECC